MALEIEREREREEKERERQSHRGLRREIGIEGTLTSNS
jgi:hypothetical protein